MWNEAVEVIEATEAVEAVEVIEATDILRPGKSLLSTPESSRLLNLALFWCFENHFFKWDHEISFFNFYTFSVGGCWGQPKLLFWKLVLIIKMSTSQDLKTTFKYNLTWTFLSLRAKLKTPLCPRTPCRQEVRCQNWCWKSVFVIVIFFNCSQVLQFGAGGCINSK